MRINLRGADIGMPQHRLNAAQISAAFEQVRGKRVPQYVRT